MQATASPVLRDIVLIGGGHSHVGVLHMFAMKPMPGVRLTVICTDTDTPYSGMLPGYIAGHYSFDEVHIDLRRLAEFAGARYYRDEVVGIDRAGRQVLCRKRPPVTYDALSINIGSTPQLAQVAGASEHAVPVKPIRRFNERWLALLDRVCQHPGATTIALVGAGAGGVELTLAMQYRLRNELLVRGRNPDELKFHLFSAGAQILPTHNAKVRRAFEGVLAERGIVVHLAAEVTQVAANSLQTASGERLAADEIVWVTQAGGAPWLRETGLALDEKGFVRVHDSLQTEPVAQALKMALRARQSDQRLVHHSDRGIQYCSNYYQAIHQRHGLLCSMTDGYDCYQNALAERVNGILKGELLLQRPADLEQARRMVRESVQIYNGERPH